MQFRVDISLHFRQNFRKLFGNLLNKDKQLQCQKKWLRLIFSCPYLFQF